MVDWQPQPLTARTWHNCTAKNVRTCTCDSKTSGSLGVGTDTLPTPLNLRCWRLRTDPSCPLCGHKHPTIHHILSNWHFNKKVTLGVTSAHPLVRGNELILIKLTIPHNSLESLSNARDCKSQGKPICNLLVIQKQRPYSHRDWLNWSLASIFQRALLKGAPLLTKLAARKTMNKAARKVIWSLPSDFQGTIGESMESILYIPYCDCSLALAKNMLSCSLQP